MKRPRPKFSLIAPDILAWRALDRTVPGAVMFAVPGFHSSKPFQEPPEYPSCPAGVHDPFSAPAAHAMGVPGWGPHPPRPQPVEYCVGLRFTNLSAAPFRFDKILVEISPSTGFGGAFSTTITQEEKEWVIHPGGTWDQVVGTSGYTGDLVRESGGRPLRLGLAMLLRGRPADGPWHTQLPALPDLPRFDPDFFSAQEKIPQGARRLPIPSITDN